MGKTMIGSAVAVALFGGSIVVAYQEGGCTDPCDDGDVCTINDVCVDGVCVGTYQAQPFGDLAEALGIVDVDDLLCVLSGFSDPAICTNGDIASARPNDCVPDGVLSYEDVVAVVYGFECAPICPDTCPPLPAPITDPTQRTVRATKRALGERPLVEGGIAGIVPRVFMVPNAIEIASTEAADYTFVVTLFLEDTVSAGVGPVVAYQMALPLDALPIGTTTGSVAHDVLIDSTNTACGRSPCIDANNPEYLFGGVLSIVAADAGDCNDTGSNPRIGAATLPLSPVDAVDPVYIGEFAYIASLDASGDFSITIQEPDVGDFGESFIRAEPAANIPFDFDDPGVLVSIPACACLDGSKILGAFTKFDCINNQGGDQWGLPYGDVTPVFGVVDFDDVLCVLNGFSNVGDCPQGDIAGDVQSPCVPNGVIDFDDVLAVLNAFADNSACPGSCGA